MSKIVNEKINNAFVNWWHDEGSGMRPLDNEDKEEHTKRVSEVAWNNAIFYAVCKVMEAKLNENNDCK